MDAIFINSKNSSNFDPHRLILNHTDTINLKRSEKYVVYQSYYILYIENIYIYIYIYYIYIYTYKNNRFKIAPATWNGKFELSDRSHSVSGIQDYLDQIIFKKYETLTDNLPVRIYVNKI